MALESLSNPLERQRVTGGRDSFLGNWRSDAVTNDLLYDAARQYFRGDTAVSAVDGACYTFTGGVVAAPAPGDPVNPIPASTLGGPDPYDDPLWIRNAPFAWYYSLAPTVANGAPANPNTWAVTGGAQTGLKGDTDWLCVVQGTATLVGGVAADSSQIVLSSTGGAGPAATVSVSVQAGLDAAGVNNFSSSAVLTLPADATGISVTGTYAATFVPVTNFKVNLIQLF